MKLEEDLPQHSDNLSQERQIPSDVRVGLIDRGGLCWCGSGLLSPGLYWSE